MASARDLRRFALSLRGTVEVPHFNRAAFKVVRIYVTLAPDGQTANFKFTPDEQEFRCMMAPHAFAPVANAWGKQGWTTGTLAQMNIGDLSAALEMAWRHAQPRKHRPKQQLGQMNERSLRAATTARRERQKWVKFGHGIEAFGESVVPQES